MDNFIKNILKDRKEMKKNSIFTVDTEKVLQTALEAGCELVNFFYCEGGEALPDVFPYIREKAQRVKKSFIDKNASVKTHSGFVALLKHKGPDADTVNTNFVVVLDTVQDPSNVGAIMRNGAAFGFLDYLLADSAYHLSEKAIRSSAGAVFFCRVSYMTRPEIILALKGRTVFAAESKGGIPPETAVHRIKQKKYALILGSEGRGVSEEMLSVTDVRIRIPHKNNNIESLNVASASAVILYELSRLE